VTESAALKSYFTMQGEKLRHDSSTVVRATYYISEATQIDQIIPVLGATFAAIRPATTVVIAQLMKPEMKIEIEVTAYKGL
jgi:enamine deaminase RidA (YjgF/YER057c/UK114 family)